MRPMHAKLVLGGAMLGLLGGAVGLERCPQVIGFVAAPAQAAMVSVPGRMSTWPQIKDGDVYGYQAVVFHLDAVSAHGAETALKNASGLVAHQADGGSRVCANTPPCEIKPREDGAPSPTYGASNPKDGAFKVVATERQIALRAEAKGPRKFAATPTFRWVVVTAWQAEDGSRLVLTTARTSFGQGRVYSDTGAAASDGPELQQSEEVYPYAAVPVRGGWLVFQL